MKKTFGTILLVIGGLSAFVSLFIAFIFLFLPESDIELSLRIICTAACLADTAVSVFAAWAGLCLRAGVSLIPKKADAAAKSTPKPHKNCAEPEGDENCNVCND